MWAEAGEAADRAQWEGKRGAEFLGGTTNQAFSNCQETWRCATRLLISSVQEYGQSLQNYNFD